ncbi:unnamed protein product [Paramecium primaurelia]|uniref:WD40-repeat-containing domain n=1 Tax=Paramecium primaurelia TaxID=5886 RepID=A0A8S1QM92_PARPR|nr:unnamed protein product [Paramecium primaurelia]
MENQVNQEQIIGQITTLNNSLCIKVNEKLSALQNQELYSQCKRTLINLNLNHHIKLIDDSIKQTVTCYAISFNLSGSLMISASNSKIKVWNFEQGRMNEISTINGHTQTISCLQFSKNSNSFLSAGFDNSIRCWKQVNQKEWKSSQSYLQHTNCIDCLILNQFENQLVSGGRDNSIKIWKIDFVNNQLIYFYSLDKHKSSVNSLCLNQTEDTLVSCGADKQLIIWKQDNKQKWKFEYVVTQSIQEFGCRLCFINEDQFIFVTGNQVSKDCISTFELKNQKYQENFEKELRLNKNDQQSDLNFFPICYDKKKNLMIVKHKNYVYLIKKSNEGHQIISQIKYQSNGMIGALTNDGKYLVTWDEVGQKFKVYELYIN